MMQIKKQTLARLALLLTTLLWGSGFIVVKESVNSLPPVTLIALRFSFAALVLALIFCKRLKSIDMAYIWRGAVIGFFLFSAYAAQTIGITGTTPGNNAFLTAVYVIIVPFLYWPIEKRRPKMRNLIAAALCLAGIGLVSLKGNFTIGSGDALTLLCGVLFACHIVSVAKLTGARDPVIITILQFFFAALFSFGFAAFTEDMTAPLPVNALPGLAYLVFGCTAAALLMQNIGQKYLHPSSASVIMSLEAVFGVLFSVLFGYEHPDAKTYIGFAIIFAALIISESRPGFLKKRSMQREEQH